MTANPYVCALLFGDYPQLHDRLLSGFMRTLPRTVPVELWCNQVCDTTRRLIERSPQFTVTFSDENVPKYVAMRTMFEKLKQPRAENWVVWFDDDTAVTEDNWLTTTTDWIDLNPNAQYIGQQWSVSHLPGQEEFIRSSKWYQGKPSEIIKGKPGVYFAQGSYWWLRMDMLRQLDWPDQRLRHNGGDTLLGEAVRQSGCQLYNFSRGIKPNNAARRGMNDAPAGSKVQCRR